MPAVQYTTRSVASVSFHTHGTPGAPPRVRARALRLAAPAPAGPWCAPSSIVRDARCTQPAAGNRYAVASHRRPRTLRGRATTPPAATGSGRRPLAAPRAARNRVLSVKRPARPYKFGATENRFAAGRREGMRGRLGLRGADGGELRGEAGVAAAQRLLRSRRGPHV